MALRGPDGSMMTATDGLYEERSSVFAIFGIGLACTLSSVVLCVWLMLHWEAALVCMSITLITCRKVYVNYQRVRKKFDFDESETVDFREIFDASNNWTSNNRQQKGRTGTSADNPHTKSTPNAHNKRRGNNRQNSWNHSPSASISSDDDNEAAPMVARKFGCRSGVQRRVTASGSSSIASKESIGEYPANVHIQTV